MTRYSLIASLLLAAIPVFAAPPTQCSADSAGGLRVMSWNIWHGGKEDGAEIGPRRVVDVIRDSGADVIAMQETYGSGELIAKELGFHFHPRGTNVSILSRYRVVEDISVFEDFKCAGAIIELPDGKRVAFYSIWLPYNADIWMPGARDTSDHQALLDACQASAVDLKEIQAAIDERLGDPKYSDIPIFIAGDFNSMSHLDWSDVNVDQYGAAIRWPTSQVLIDAGYRDSYREVNPFVDRTADRTWTPRFPDQEQDRIDFIYYRGNSWQATESRIIDQHADKFPSDHAALLTRFKASTPPEAETNFRIVSYNIKHGHGMDDVVDLNRTAAVLAKLHPDFVGLQEVDQATSRTLDLLRQDKLEAKKPANDRFTFSSTNPKAEIDFIFVAPPAVWKIQNTVVVDEPLASDHRPVLAEITIQTDSPSLN